MLSVFMLSVIMLRVIRPSFDKINQGTALMEQRTLKM